MVEVGYCGTKGEPEGRCLRGDRFQNVTEGETAK